MLSNSQFLDISRDRLFFDRYQYCMRFFFAHSGRMRSLDHNDITNRVLWTRTHSDWMPHGKFIPDQHLAKMLTLSDMITAIDRPFKRVVFADTQHLYTNHPEIFVAIADLPGVSNVCYSEAVVNRPRDCVTLIRSDYSWRTWFKERIYDNDQAELLANFILSRPHQFRITAGFRDKLAIMTNHTNKIKSLNYVSSSVFVDHHNQHDSLLLSLAVPGCVRKTLPINSRE